MKITKQQLKQIIKEELTQILSENDDIARRIAHFEIFWEEKEKGKWEEKEKGKYLYDVFVKTLSTSQPMIHHRDAAEEALSSWFIPRHRKDDVHYLKAKDSFQIMADKIEELSREKIEKLWRDWSQHNATGRYEAFKNGMKELYLALAEVHDNLPDLNRI